jgi:glycine betaine/proline transport system substrate-binding protein
MNVDSIADLKSEAGKKVTAIEPGAGVTKGAEKAIKDYGLNSQGWQVTPSSSGAMAVALGKAIKAKQDIVVTGWEPHWMFQKYDLKYLKDPKKSFGGAETINTMTRKDLKQDKPDAYKVLKKFKWTKEDMGKVMLDIQNGKSAKQAANTWIKNNQSKVDSWFK